MLAAGGPNDERDEDDGKVGGSKGRRYHDSRYVGEGRMLERSSAWPTRE